MNLLSEKIDAFLTDDKATPDQVSIQLQDSSAHLYTKTFEPCVNKSSLRSGVAEKKV